MMSVYLTLPRLPAFFFLLSAPFCLCALSLLYYYYYPLIFLLTVTLFSIKWPLIVVLPYASKSAGPQDKYEYSVGSSSDWRVQTSCKIRQEPRLPQNKAESDRKCWHVSRAGPWKMTLVGRKNIHPGDFVSKDLGVREDNICCKVQPSRLLCHKWRVHAGSGKTKGCKSRVDANCRWTWMPG